MRTYFPPEQNRLIEINVTVDIIHGMYLIYFTQYNRRLNLNTSLISGFVRTVLLSLNQDFEGRRRNPG